MSTFTSRALRSALLASSATALIAMSASASVVAQEADDEVEEVIVTGSRIVRKDLQAASPVTVLNSEEITFTGTTRMEDLVSSLPQAFAAQNSTVANGASGAATVSLRGLGSSRTLVLMNGRRMVAGDAFDPAPDLNFIPNQLVKRVDVLTGGASSVYGPDAVSGVVNFVMDTDFEGLKFSAQHSFYQHNNDNEEMQQINEDLGFDVIKGNITDGKQWNVSMALGSSFADGRGHASGYVTYRDIGSITKAGRDYTACTVSTGSTGPRCGGSSTSQYGRFNVREITGPKYEEDGVTQATDPVTGDLLWKYSTKAYVLDWAGPGNTFKKRNGEVYNYGPLNHIQRPDTKWSAGGFVNYQVTDNAEAYIEAMFMDDYTRAQIAPSGNFGRTSDINCNNPMFSEQQFNIMCQKTGITALSQADYNATFAPGEIGDLAPVAILRRNVEGGNRTNIIRHTTYRVVAGLRGQLNDAWSYDVYGMNAANVGSDTYINDLNTNRIYDALIVVNDANGNAVCASGNEGCVPWNIFTKGAVTKAATDYISTIAVMNYNTTLKMASASFTGDLGQYDVVVPGATEGAQVAGGIEYREEGMEAIPDEVFNKGLRAGSGSRTPAYDVGFNTLELFGEAVIPLVQGQEMMQDLALELAGRYTEHNITGGDFTYKVAATWQVDDNVKFRGGYNRAVRSPGLTNFFAPQNTGLAGMQDPCAVTAQGGPSASLEECLRTGATKDQYEGGIPGNDANQYNTVTGGNPNLKPETADTFTLGAVITPVDLPGFSATLDYYNIKITDTIGSLGASDILETCLATGAQSLCSLIHRNSVDGNLWVSSDAYIETTQQNIGILKAEGIDVNMNYTMEFMDAGDLIFGLVGTYLMADKFENPLTNYDCVGYFGSQCGAPRSTWKHKLRVTWANNYDTRFSMQWRYTGKVDNDDFSDNPNIGNSGNHDLWITNGADKVGAQSYFDLSVTQQLNENWSASAGVNNFLDKEPPVLPSLTSTGYAGAYDTLGRYIFFSIKANY